MEGSCRQMTGLFSECSREILNIIQERFPVCERPYHSIAEMVGCGEEEVFRTISQLRKDGVIRRIGGVFVSERLGYTSRLCCGILPPEELGGYEEYTAHINSLTHNYVRSHRYNIWLTLIAESPDAVADTLFDITENTALHSVHVLSALKKYKIRTYFPMESGARVFAAGKQRLCRRVNTLDFDTKRVIATIQDDLPYSAEPFADWADFLGISCGELISRVEEMRDNGVMRRFGAILRHQKAGFVENAMVVFAVPHETADQAGEMLARFDEVSHCYEREPFSDFPYNLYAMVHARSAVKMSVSLEKLAQAAGTDKYIVLRSEKELKKTSMKYFPELAVCSL